jgi:hypothetical protein
MSTEWATLQRDMSPVRRIDILAKNLSISRKDTLLPSPPKREYL